MKVFQICTKAASTKLLTSDRPTMLSSQLVGRDGFIVFPSAPDRIVVLANDRALAEAFYTQEPDTLVSAINDAVVQQAQTIVIGSDRSLTDLVADRFLRSKETTVGATDKNGMVRWRSPLVRFEIQLRQISRHRKREMRYR